MSYKLDLESLLIKTALKSNMEHKHACVITLFIIRLYLKVFLPICVINYLINIIFIKLK